MSGLPQASFAHASYVGLYASRLVKAGLSRQSTWRSLNLLGDLMSWLTRIGSMPTDLNERMVEQYLWHRSRKQSIQPGDRAADDQPVVRIQLVILANDHP
jgi:hypothetical protein